MLGVHNEEFKPLPDAQPIPVPAEDKLEASGKEHPRDSVSP